MGARALRSSHPSLSPTTKANNGIKSVSNTESSELNSRFPHATLGTRCKLRNENEACPDSRAISVDNEKSRFIGGLSRKQSNQGYSNDTQRRTDVCFPTQPANCRDPRPLGEKSYTNNNIQYLMSYLSCHGHTSLSPKTFTSPTAKEFATLSLFLFCKVDKKFKFGLRAEDDISLIFKQLRYPIQVSKNALYAVGSPHTWPSLLAALTWLVQLFVYAEKAQQNPEKQLGQFKPDAAFFGYIKSAYGFFLAGNDEGCDVVQHNYFSEKFTSKSHFFKATRGIEKNNYELEVVLASLMSKTPNTIGLQKEKVIRASAIKKLSEDTIKVLCIVEGADIHVEFTKQETRLSERRMDVCLRNISALKQSEILNSKYKSFTRSKTNSGDQVRDKEIHAIIQSQRSVVDSCTVTDIAMTESALDLLKGKAEVYCSSARSIQLLPHSSLNAVAVGKYSYNCLQDMDNFKNSVWRTIKIKRRDLALLKRTAERELEDIAEELHFCSETCIKRRVEEHELTLNGFLCDSSYEKERSRLHCLLEATLRELAHAENEVLNLRENCKLNVSRTDSSLIALQAIYDTDINRYGQERLAVQNMMLAALDALMGHKQQVQDAMNLESPLTDFNWGETTTLL